jgi:YHYH protein
MTTKRLVLLPVLACHMACAVGADLSTGFEATSWGENADVSIADAALRYVSNGIPDHARQAEYAVPDDLDSIPDGSNSSAVADPTIEQDYDFTIPLTPTPAWFTTSTSLGVIGLMISGAALFNPFEGDGSTVATQSNFSVKNDAGEDVFFLDDCSGHPTPPGQYHYHALPACVVDVVDDEGGPSHAIGIALDGYPIYGDRDIDGAVIDPDTLDECNGIDSVTPEFPEGVYHYVLLDVQGPQSSIQCFKGSAIDAHSH